jgi:DNA-3-methyladenine glycosylase II
VDNTFVLRANPPFRLDLTVNALRRKNSNIIDQWDGFCYQRVLVVCNKPVLISVCQKNVKTPTLTVTTHRHVLDFEKNMIKKILRTILGLRYKADNFYALALKDKHLKLMVTRLIGLKPPRFPSIFESLCNAVACQQLSLNVGIVLLNRFSEHYGKKITVNKKTHFAFPTPMNISKCKPRALMKLGFSLTKSKTIIKIANLLKKDEPSLNKKFLHQKDEQIMSFLLQIKGIGRWSCEYVLLRGFGRMHIFPGDDIGAQNNLKRLLKIRKKMDYESVAKIVKPWYPFSGYVYFHLLLSNNLLLTI